MRHLALLLLLFILIDCHVGVQACTTNRKCERRGIRMGVTSYCLPKNEWDTCTGRVMVEDGRKRPICNGVDCGCCVPDSGIHVRASFKLDNTVYNEALRNTSSPDYKELAEIVKKEVLETKAQYQLIDIRPEFFANGSAIDDSGTSDSVIVDSLVLAPNKGNNGRRRRSVDTETQYAANQYIKGILKRSGVPDLDISSVMVGVRICVTGNSAYDACISMETAKPSLNIICVEARDSSRYQCLQAVKHNEADVVHAEAKDIFMASETFDDSLSVVAKTVDTNKEDEACSDCILAVVRRTTVTNLADLNGKDACFTDYHKTDGWFVPFSKLLEKNVCTCNGDGTVTEKNLDALSTCFNDACLPGEWSSNPATNTALKAEHPDLCALCDGSCDAPSGYNGVLQCLTNKNADVAWTTHDAVTSAALSNSDFGLLCLDGSIMDLNADDPCCWGGKPWSGWLIKNSNNATATNIIVSTVEAATTDAQQKPVEWAEPLLGTSKSSVTKNIDSPVTPKNYLEECDYYSVLSNPGCDGSTLKWCVIDQNELNKCNELKQVLKSRLVRPLFDCIKTADKEGCITKIASGAADFVSLDGGDVFSGYRNNDIIPIISELYGEHAASYFAVAVVKSNSGINSLTNLQGKDSCHTGIAKTAGWNMPLINLIKKDLIKKAECNYTKQMGDFFKDSCAPGALYTKYNPYGTNPPSLCDKCIGNGADPPEYKCNRDSNELYYGYTGAFRCLVADAGDVAFVKHTTVPGNAGDNCDEDWCSGVNLDDYELLCPDGGRKSVGEYLNCYLGIAPSHMVVTKYAADDVLKGNIRILLLAASDLLPPGNDVFALFGDYGSYKDILFKGSATGLINLSNTEFDELKSGSYWEALEANAAC